MFTFYLRDLWLDGKKQCVLDTVQNFEVIPPVNCLQNTNKRLQKCIQPGVIAQHILNLSVHCPGQSVSSPKSKNTFFAISKYLLKELYQIPLQKSQQTQNTLSQSTILYVPLRSPCKFLHSIPFFPSLISCLKPVHGTYISPVSPTYQSNLLTQALLIYRLLQYVLVISLACVLEIHLPHAREVNGMAFSPSLTEIRITQVYFKHLHTLNSFY